MLRLFGGIKQKNKNEPAVDFLPYKREFEVRRIEGYGFGGNNRKQGKDSSAIKHLGKAVVERIY